MNYPSKSAVKPITSQTQRGALLVESMVALAIFSIAMLSLSGLQISSSKSSFSSMLKTESAVSVSEMIDNMRSNLTGVGSGHYNIDYADDPVLFANAANQGERDIATWLAKLSLSAMKGTSPDTQIACVGLVCRIQLRWDDSRAEQDLRSDGSSTTNYEYVFDVNF